MRLGASLLTGLLGLAAQVSADPTWPSNIDELEEIMYQVFSFNSRKFADNVNPCSREVFTAGRKNAAEWLRTAFHDMSTANIYQNFGGLDASLQFELGPNSENTGPAFANTLTFLSPYVTRKSSMSDLIALGVYTSVLSCGGPAVPFRAGRVDATQAGNPGVPQPQNDIATFRNQFLRLGFSPQEMIQVTACGHTIGGVHSAENPDIVPAGRFTDDVATFDTTDAVFDNKIVTEYLDGTTKNPLVVRFGTSTLKSSDLKVFNSDRNVTMRGMRDPGTFQSVCGTVFEKMINVVPPGVTLGDPITPYQVKPVQVQLTLSSLASMQLTGSIRVLSTPTTYTNIAGVTINYKNRSGGTTCGSGPCSFNLNLQGTTRSLDNNIFFVWFPITQQFVPTSSGISSFTITVNMKDGSSKLYDNNGNGYPVQDGVFLQSPQSCLDKSAGTGTFVAAVRNDRASLPVTMEITYKTRLIDNTNVATSLKKMTLDMTKGDCRGSYTFFTASVSIPGGVSVESTIDVISGSGASAVVDSFKKAGIAGGTCQSWTGGSTCSSVTVSSITPSTTSSSAAPTASLHHRDTMGGYKLVSCWTEASNGRALTGAAFSYDGMTLDSCMKNCTGFNYWGTEYGRECYCGNSLDATSTSAALGDCNFPCSGDSTQYCGAGNRIELYSTTASIAAPTATLAHVPVVGKFSLVGCQTEAANNQRALQGAQTVSDSMTLEMCATFCSDFTYFGTEYGRECYCGNSLLDTSKPALITECNMKCSGNPYQYCGDGFRLDLYKVSSTSSSSVVSTAAATPTSSGSSTFVTSSEQRFSICPCYCQCFAHHLAGHHIVLKRGLRHFYLVSTGFVDFYIVFKQQPLNLQQCICVSQWPTYIARQHGRINVYTVTFSHSEQSVLFNSGLFK
ncbi:WSC domain-containing protein [Colletotrichum sidae]|uniref:WSC domain-containing protein n=1 Tax=Colletotrichum sidae TaxID=1347389 RepID=A0A4R8THB2_9PEZI|nr:WSC domain-containing protein [Colletotrichum sidae]